MQSLFCAIASRIKSFMNTLRAGGESSEDHLAHGSHWLVSKPLTERRRFPRHPQQVADAARNVSAHSFD